MFPIREHARLLGHRPSPHVIPHKHTAGRGSYSVISVGMFLCIEGALDAPVDYLGVPSFRWKLSLRGNLVVVPCFLPTVFLKRTEGTGLWH